MDASVASITPAALRQSLLSTRPPLVIDVRREERFRESPYLLRGALRRDPARVGQWREALPSSAHVVVYCVHGHEVSQGVARALGVPYLEGGLEGWREEHGELDAKPAGAATRWVTRERPKIDRIACPWLVRRFVDADAEFLYVPPAEVETVAEARSAVPYDIPAVPFSHEGERCSFDAFLRHYHLEEDRALQALALIVRAADTHRHELAPQAAGLAAISLGLSRLHGDDLALLEQGLGVYDALYAWCKEGMDEVHSWNPRACR